jgi:hypothetical protein
MVTLAAIRSAVRPRASRTILLTLIGVIAIVVGLLTMHTLSLDGPAHSPVAAAAPIEHHAEGPAHGEQTPATSGACGAVGCDPTHTLGLMSCVLALLLAPLIVAAMPSIALLVATLWSIGRALISALLAASPGPPSLIALSISRT